MGRHHQPTLAERPPRPAEPAPPPPGRADLVIAGVALAVLALWIAVSGLFALVVVGASLPDCDADPAAICTPAGRIAGPFAAPAGAALGMALILLECMIRPRGRYGTSVLGALGLALLGAAVTLALVSDAPGEG